MNGRTFLQNLLKSMHIFSFPDTFCMIMYVHVYEIGWTRRIPPYCTQGIGRFRQQDFRMVLTIHPRVILYIQLVCQRMTNHDNTHFITGSHCSAVGDSGLVNVDCHTRRGSKQSAASSVCQISFFQGQSREECMISFQEGTALSSTDPCETILQK